MYSIQDTHNVFNIIKTMCTVDNEIDTQDTVENSILLISSFTQLTNYDVHGEKRGSPTVLSLYDVMALGDDDTAGLTFSDALAVIKGHVPQGYKVQLWTLSRRWL